VLERCVLVSIVFVADLVDWWRFFDCGHDTAMTLLLNHESVQTGGHPASVELFADSGSIVHLLFGMLAGSYMVAPKDSVLMLAAFTGYQVSQAQSGESWSRTGGEFLEFAIGMLLGSQARGIWNGVRRIAVN
jgi:hypothetical protein